MQGIEPGNGGLCQGGTVARVIGQRHCEKELPVSPKMLEDEVFSLFLQLQGDLNLETQLQGALAEKKTALVPGDIPALKAIMQRHVAGSEKKLAALGRAPTAKLKAPKP